MKSKTEFLVQEHPLDGLYRSPPAGGNNSLVSSDKERKCSQISVHP